MYSRQFKDEGLRTECYSIEGPRIMKTLNPRPKTQGSLIMKSTLNPKH